MSFVIRLVHQRFSFGIQEILSLTEHLGHAAVDVSCPFVCIRGVSEREAGLVVSRSVFCKEGYECYSRAGSRQDLLALVRQQSLSGRFDRFRHLTFRFEVVSFGKRYSLEEKLEMIQEYSFLPLGGVDLSSPQVRLAVLVRSDLGSVGEEWYFCRYIQQGRRRTISKYDVKKRQYIGMTSMDAELSLVMSNLAQIGPGSLVYDPFVGTGSFLMTSAEFGAYSLGSDIDGRQLRGTDGVCVLSNSRQYGVEHLVLDTMIFDLAHSPWRLEGVFDAIITDPPYGVRAGAKRIRTAPGSRVKDRMNPPYPLMEPYPLEELVRDLVGFSAKHLRSGGRLVYWQPCEKEQELKIPCHEQMRMVSKTEQELRGWSRWLIVMEKLK